MTAELDTLSKRATELIELRSDSTKRAYRSDFKIFGKWCLRHGLRALPATTETVIAYLVDRSDAGAKTATIERSICSISQAHKLSNFTNPTNSPAVFEVMKGIRRYKKQPQKRARPLLFEQLARIVSTQGANIRAKRDCALLVLGWACAMRSAEVVALQRRDIESTPDGMIVTIRSSKTDQTGTGRKLGIPFAGSGSPFCPVQIVQLWRDLSKSQDDTAEAPLFFGLVKGCSKSFFNFSKNKKALSTKSVSIVLRRAMLAAGYDPSGYSSHSLRAGFCTSAAAAGVPELAIMEHTAHRSSKMLRIYIREASIFKNNPLVKLFCATPAELTEKTESN